MFAQDKKCNLRNLNVSLCCNFVRYNMSEKTYTNYLTMFLKGVKTGHKNTVTESKSRAIGFLEYMNISTDGIFLVRIYQEAGMTYNRHFMYYNCLQYDFFLNIGRPWKVLHSSHQCSDGIGLIKRVSSR